MPNSTKQEFLVELARRGGRVKQLEGSHSLFEIGDGGVRIYVRYSKLHSRKQTFYGLRKDDLRQLEGRQSVVCFLWDDQDEPLIVPFADFEELFQTLQAAADGQYKVQVYPQREGTELYIARAGRFNVESYLGWHELEKLLEADLAGPVPDLTHSQVQTLLGAIGSVKKYDIWVPQPDRERLDWSLADRFRCRDRLPVGLEKVKSILQEVDLVWIDRGSSEPRALFEVEHSTPIYTGLLRFNDVHIAIPGLKPRFSIVANDSRRSVFVRQLNRPTFQSSGLSEMCNFLEYANVYAWFQRTREKR